MRIIKCEDCGENKPYYSKGLCRRCYSNQYRKANIEAATAYKKKWNDANKEMTAATCRKYYEDHPRFVFRGEQLPLLNHKAVPKGYGYHHIAYDFAHPEEFMVLVSNSYHGLIHNPKGNSFHERGYSLID